MVDVRRILVIFVIATLFSILVFTSIDAFYPSPDYRDYCDNYRGYEEPRPVKQRPENYTCPDKEFNTSEMDECVNSEGIVQYEYDEYNCQASWECSYCQKNYQDAREQHNFARFMISAILGLIAVLIGIYLPKNGNDVNEWIGSGLMLGGMISIFVGTAMTFGDLHRWLRPLIILLELLLVIYLAYRKLGKE